MRDIIFILIGAASGYKAITRARTDIARFRITGETFGEGHFTNTKGSTPIVVAISSALYFLLAQRFDHNLTVLTYGVLVGAGMWLSLIDFDTHLLPRRIVYRTIAVAMPLLVLSAFFDNTGSIAGMFIGGIAMWCMLRVLEVLSRGDLGGGDVGLGALLGLYLGWLSYEAILVGLFASFLVGGLFAVALLVTRKANRHTHFAFGPFLIVGTLIAVLR
jgi:prepilin signal peptidase PulO-like enzyme (type II secretory pathway)